MLALGIILGIVAFYIGKNAYKNLKGWKSWIACVVCAIIALICFGSGMMTLVNDEPSRWSQLSKDEQNNIKQNIEIGKELGLLD